MPDAVVPGYVEGQYLDVQSLLDEQPLCTELRIYTVRKAELGKLRGLDRLPLKSLELRWLSSPDLTDVPLPVSLVDLMIWHSSKLRSLKGLEAAPNIENLILEDNAPLDDATAISHLKNLRSLSIQGGFSSQQKLASLDAIEGLPIERLTLRAIAGADLDLSPVARLKKLHELDLHGPNFDPGELAKVAAAHPWFLDQLLQLSDYPLGGMGCKKCGGVQKEMFLRRKKFLRCPTCDENGIRREVQGFLELVDEARRSSA